MRITIGADPEFFLENSRGKRIPAVGLVPGTKDKPYPLKRGAVQLDGTAVEFNIKPALTPEGFVINIRSVLKEVRSMIPAEYKFLFSPAVTYAADVFDSLPETAKELGCTPDIDARTGSYNPTPVASGALARMRTGAGHLHIGWGNGFDVDSRSHRWDAFEVVKQLDGVFQDFEKYWDNTDAGAKRRQLYGKLGACRVKPYGVEYRSLSNAWVGKPKLHAWLHKATKAVTEATIDGSAQLNTGDGPFYRNWCWYNTVNEAVASKIKRSNEYYSRRIKNFPEFSATMLED